jgi:hypothetical protein
MEVRVTRHGPKKEGVSAVASVNFETAYSWMVHISFRFSVACFWMAIDFHALSVEILSRRNWLSEIGFDSIE